MPAKARGKEERQLELESNETHRRKCLKRTLDAIDEGLERDLDELAEGAGERGGEGTTRCTPTPS